MSTAVQNFHPLGATTEDVSPRPPPGPRLGFQTAAPIARCLSRSSTGTGLAMPTEPLTQAEAGSGGGNGASGKNGRAKSGTGESRDGKNRHTNG